MKILVMILDGKMDRDADIFDENTQISFPEIVSLRHYPVGGPLDTSTSYGKARLVREDNKIYAEIFDSQLPVCILGEFYPGVSGDYLGKDNNKVTAASIDAATFHLRKNADDRINRIGIQLKEGKT